jgi:predicted DNA-binding transcriptional regulator AlpA
VATQNRALPASPEQILVCDSEERRIVGNLSRRQRDRLEAAGRYPKSVPLGGIGKNPRKARVLSEILAWVEDRKAERGRVVVTPIAGDRDGAAA